MAATVKIDFKIGNLADVERAMASIGTVAKSSAARVAREQGKADQQRVSASKAATAKLLSDAEAAANAQIGIIKRVNRARVEAAKQTLALDKELEAEHARIDASRAAAATKRKSEAAAAVAQRKADLTAAREQQAIASNRRQAKVDIASGAAGGFKAGVGILGGAFTVAAGQSIRQQMSLDERAALLRSASGKSKSDFDSVAQAKSLSNLTGVGAEEVMGGFEKLSGKAGGGGLTEFKDKFEELAKVAHGAGVNMADLGDTLGTLYNRGVKADSVVKVVEALVQQGKDGAVEFNQLAVLLDASSGALGRFKMDDATRVMSAGGLSQFARTFGKKSAEEATNAVEDLARDLGGKADVIQKLTGGSATTVHTKGKKTKKLVNGKMVETTEGDTTKTTYAGGVEVGTDATRAQLKDINTLLPDIIEGVAKSGNAGKLMGEGGIFTGNATAIAGPLLQAFTKGIALNKEGRYQLTGDGETAGLTGRAAVEALLKQFQASEVAVGSSQKAFDDRMNQSQAKLNQSIERLKNDLGTQLAPVASKAVENPKTAMAAMVGVMTAGGAMKAGADVAGTALMEKIFPKTIANMSVNAANVVVGGGVPGGGVPTSTPGGGGKFAALAATFGAPAAAIAADVAIKKKLIDSGVDSGKSTGVDQAMEATNLARKIRSGQGTAEDINRAQALSKVLDMQQGGVFSRMGATAAGVGDQIRKDGVSLSSVGKILSMPLAMATGAAQNDTNAQANAKGASEDLKTALASLKPDATAQGAAMAAPIAEAVGAAVSNAVAAGGLQSAKAQPID